MEWWRLGECTHPVFVCICIARGLDPSSLQLDLTTYVKSRIILTGGAYKISLSKACF